MLGRGLGRKWEVRQAEMIKRKAARGGKGHMISYQLYHLIKKRLKSKQNQIEFVGHFIFCPWGGLFYSLGSSSEGTWPIKHVTPAKVCQAMARLLHECTKHLNIFTTLTLSDIIIVSRITNVSYRGCFTFCSWYLLLNKCDSTSHTVNMVLKFQKCIKTFDLKRLYQIVRFEFTLIMQNISHISC